jgi:tripartite-type tricarboxylate transporter receptor subunit TctC
MKPVAAAVAAGCLLLSAPLVIAQAYPNKPVRILVGFAPGGATDVTARIIALKLGEAWNQTVVVENRPGASGIIGAELVTKAAPDGYTLLVSPQTSTAVAATLYPKLPYDVLKDFSTLGVVGSTPQILVLHPSLPPKTFQEFVPFAKTNAKQLACGSGGLGSTPHLALELLNLSLGVKILHIPYKGENPALADVLGGQLPLMFSNLPVALPQVRGGKVRGIAITSLQRSDNAPDIPTIAESGIPGFDTATWNGLYGPAGLPKELVARIGGDVTKVLALPDTRERYKAQGIDRIPSSPEQHAAFLKADITKWAKVIKAADMRVDQ